MIREGYFFIPEENGKPSVHDDLFKFDESLIPLIYKKTNINENLLTQFNLNPIDNYDEFISVLGSDPSPKEIAMFLFFSATSPHALSILFYKANLFSDPFPYIFFRSPIISMLSFYDSLKILLTRVSIPFTESSFLLYIKSIGQVLQEHNFFKGIPLRGISALVICIIIVLWNIFLDQPLSQSTFLQLCSQNSACQVFGDYALKCFYSQFSANPIDISYAFLDTKYPPQKIMSGTLQMKGLMKKMKDVQAELANDQLLLYSDKSKKVVVGGFSAEQVIFISPLSKNKPNTFEIQSTSGEPFSYRDHGKIIHTDKNSYTFKCSSKDKVENWRSSIMHFGFSSTLTRTLQYQRDE